MRESAAVDLYWIPLGAGASVVRLSGKVFEAASALVQRRTARPLFHSALEVTVPGRRVIIEMLRCSTSTASDAAACRKAASG